ncbi:mucin-binding protein [Lacticaseibacillus brantae]|nr:KxYKxGKxW signal peptide domain-containing protein [Lacticaseibacillus brantae]
MRKATIEQRVHYKMYKRGKYWAIMGLFAAAFGLATTQLVQSPSVHAAETVNATTSSEPPVTTTGTADQAPDIVLDAATAPDQAVAANPKTDVAPTTDQTPISQPASVNAVATQAKVEPAAAPATQSPVDAARTGKALSDPTPASVPTTPKIDWSNWQKQGGFIYHPIWSTSEAYTKNADGTYTILSGGGETVVQGGDTKVSFGMSGVDMALPLLGDIATYTQTKQLMINGKPYTVYYNNNTTTPLVDDTKPALSIKSASLKVDTLQGLSTSYGDDTLTKTVRTNQDSGRYLYLQDSRDGKIYEVSRQIISVYTQYTSLEVTGGSAGSGVSVKLNLKAVPGTEPGSPITDNFKFLGLGTGFKVDSAGNPIPLTNADGKVTTGKDLAVYGGIIRGESIPQVIKAQYFDTQTNAAIPGTSTDVLGKGLDTDTEVPVGKSYQTIPGYQFNRAEVWQNELGLVVDYSTGKTQQTNTTGGKLNSTYKDPGNLNLFLENKKATMVIFYYDHATVSVTSDNPGVPGTPVDPAKPEGFKLPDGSDAASLTKTVTRTVDFATEDGTPVAPSQTAKITFNRTGTVDLVGNKTTYSDWNAAQNSFPAVAVPVVPGYYADQNTVAAVSGVTASSNNSKTVVTYRPLGQLVPTSTDPYFPTTTPIRFANNATDPTKAETMAVPVVAGYRTYFANLTDPSQLGRPVAQGSVITPATPGANITLFYVPNSQKATISYYDDTAQAELAHDDVTGTSGAPIDYQTASRINGYLNQGYEVISDGFAPGTKFDTNTGVDQSFVVHLKSRTVQILPGTPVVPGHPIDPTLPAGPKWPAGASQADFRRTVKETVRYQFADGTKAGDAKEAQVTFIRTGSVNLVSGGIDYQDWTVEQGQPTFAAVPTPVITSYYADQAEIPAVNGLTADSQNVEAVVTYRPLGALVTTSQDDKFPGAAKVSFSNDPLNPTAVLPIAVPDVPGYTPHFPDLATPISPKSTITPPKPGEDIHVVYTPNAQAAVIEYIDDTTGKTLSQDEVFGKSFQPIQYQTSAQIHAYQVKGYQLVSDDFPAGKIFDADDSKTQTFEVHLLQRVIAITPDKPGTPGQPVFTDQPEGPLWPNGTEANDLTHTVTQTVSYRFGQRRQALQDHVETVTFTRTGTVNLVTGEPTYSDWVAENGDTTFAAVKTPFIDGYYASRAEVPMVSDITPTTANKNELVVYRRLGSLVPTFQGDGPKASFDTPYVGDMTDPTKPGTVEVPAIRGFQPFYPDPNDPNKPGAPLKAGDLIMPVDPGTDTPILYVLSPQKARVDYIDDSIKTILESVPLTGVSNEPIDYQTAETIAAYVAKGYELVSDGWPAEATFDRDEDVDQDFEVHLTPRLVTITPTNPGVPGTPVDSDNPTGPKWPDDSSLSNLSKTITETITYEYKAGGEASPTHHDSVTFTRDGQVNVVTGAVTYGSWVAKDNDTTFDAVKTPVIVDYYADKAEIGAVSGLTVGSSNVEQTVIYDKLGALVPTSSDPRFPLKEKIPLSGDPTDATKPGTVVVPSVPGYMPYQADPTRPGRLRPIQPGTVLTPETPGIDIVISYVPIPVVTSVKPVIPVQPEIPGKPTEPATPVDPDTPADSGPQVTTGKSNKPVSVVKSSGKVLPKQPTRLAVPETDGKVSQKASGSTEKTFPQTGDNPASELTLAGVVGLLSLTLIGLAQRRKEKEE